MRKRKEQSRQGQEEKILDVNASMQGTLRFDDSVNLRINGKFEGTLDTKGKLMIGTRAEIKANITGEEISIAGKVNGNIKATSALSLEPTACLYGDVEAPSLSISQGALINGRVSMSQGGRSNAAPRGDWMTLTQLAKYLEVDSNKVNEWVSNGTLRGTREGDEWVFERTKVDQWIAEGKVSA